MFQGVLVVPWRRDTCYRKPRPAGEHGLVESFLSGLPGLLCGMSCSTYHPLPLYRCVWGAASFARHGTLRNPPVPLSATTLDSLRHQEGRRTDGATGSIQRSKRALPKGYSYRYKTVSRHHDIPLCHLLYPYPKQGGRMGRGEENPKKLDISSPRSLFHAFQGCSAAARLPAIRPKVKALPI